MLKSTELPITDPELPTMCGPPRTVNQLRRCKLNCIHLKKFSKICPPFCSDPPSKSPSSQKLTSHRLYSNIAVIIKNKNLSRQQDRIVAGSEWNDRGEQKAAVPSSLEQRDERQSTTALLGSEEWTGKGYCQSCVVMIQRSSREARHNAEGPIL